MRKRAARASGRAARVGGASGRRELAARAGGVSGRELNRVALPVDMGGGQIGAPSPSPLSTFTIATSARGKENEHIRERARERRAREWRARERRARAARAARAGGSSGTTDGVSERREQGAARAFGVSGRRELQRAKARGGGRTCACTRAAHTHTLLYEPRGGDRVRRRARRRARKRRARSGGRGRDPPHARATARVSVPVHRATGDRATGDRATDDRATGDRATGDRATGDRTISLRLPLPLYTRDTETTDLEVKRAWRARDSRELALELARAAAAHLCERERAARRGGEGSCEAAVGA